MSKNGALRSLVRPFVGICPFSGVLRWTKGILGSKYVFPQHVYTFRVHKLGLILARVVKV